MPSPETTEALDYAGLRRLLRDVRYHDFLRQGVAMALPEIERLRGGIEQAVAHLEHGDLPKQATRALGILNEALS